MKKRIVILGGGESGVGAALLCKQQGYDVFLSDGGKLKESYQQELTSYGIEFEQAGHTIEKILSADEVMKSPGIPNSNAIVKSIVENKIPIISEMELAYRHKGGSKIIGITGSNGKTTTTMLCYHILQKAGFNVGLGGNIGKSYARQVAENDFEIEAILKIQSSVKGVLFSLFFKPKDFVYIILLFFTTATERPMTG